jgi:hypothetical protein
MPKDHAVGWKLFQLLDTLAGQYNATTGDVLDVAAVILAHYMLRMRDEMEQRQATAEQLARCDLACWENLKDRARGMVVYLEQSESADHGTIH